MSFDFVLEICSQEHIIELKTSNHSWGKKKKNEHLHTTALECQVKQKTHNSTMLQYGYVRKMGE